MVKMSSLKNLDKYFVKKNVEYNEYKIHKYVYNLHIINTPRVVSYDKKTKTMVMQKIKGMNIADLYGTMLSEVPKSIIEEIENIIRLLTTGDIEYPDVTGYNFILDENEKLWIIDYGHAVFNDNITNEYLMEVCEGIQKWNPEFE
jgi:tRNA A-37 threonylcarbamoyl transferase component Bud32